MKPLNHSKYALIHLHIEKETIFHPLFFPLSLNTYHILSIMYIFDNSLLSDIILFLPFHLSDSQFTFSLYHTFYYIFSSTFVSTPLLSSHKNIYWKILRYKYARKYCVNNILQTHLYYEKGIMNYFDLYVSYML